MTVNKQKNGTTLISSDSSTLVPAENSSVAVNSSSTVIFKKPPDPSQLQRVIGSKPDAKAKSSVDDVDMKSASSVCSMDVTNVIDLTQDVDVETSKKDIPLHSKSVKETVSRSSSSSLPIITVQVMQDNVVDLTDLDQSDRRDETKKQTAKVKKDSDKPAVKKKTTISEDTKMKIRDSIFANMFAKQKGT